MLIVSRANVCLPYRAACTVSFRAMLRCNVPSYLMPRRATHDSAACSLQIEPDPRPHATNHAVVARVCH